MNLEAVTWFDGQDKGMSNFLTIPFFEVVNINNSVAALFFRMFSVMVAGSNGTVMMLIIDAGIGTSLWWISR